MILSDLEKKVIGFLREKELVELAVEMGNIYSPTGFEEKMGEFVFEWLKSNGIEVFKQEVVKNRYNVVGSTRGTGNGQTLLFNSHMDSGVGEPGGQWVLANPELAHYTKAWMEGDRIFGNAVLNDRGPMAAFMMAAKAIKESGISLKGDLLLTMVVGEIGRAPIDEFQGTQYLGKGLGSRHLVNHGVVADYVLVAETTNFGITWAQAGVAYFKITIRGESIYTPRSYRPERIEDHPNAIVKMARLIQRLEDWAVRYEKENIYQFAGGEIVPKVAVGAIRGGMPYRPCRTSGICSIYVDVRIPPGKSVLPVKHQLEQLVQSLNMEADIKIYLYRPGYEGKNVTGIIKSVERSYQKIYKKRPGKVPNDETSMWRDINIFNEVGIPAITFGPPRYSAEGSQSNWGKFFRKQDLVNTSKIYALVALDICGVEADWG
jgi:acetylornithine deacetylase/succinyl-diaminopimelate desuccinylase-like protein